MKPRVPGARAVVILALVFACAVLAVSALALGSREADERGRLMDLGADGGAQQVEVFALINEGRIDADAWRAALLDVVERQGASLAYAPHEASRVLTLVDDAGRFTIGGERLGAPFASAEAGCGYRISQELDGRARIAAAPAACTDLGSYALAEQFRGVYPAIVKNARATVFAGGVYVFTGSAETLNLDELQRLFTSRGLAILAIHPAETGTTLSTSPIGILVQVGFAVALVLSLWYCTVQLLRRLRPAGRALARIGARRGDLWGFALRRVEAAIALGVIVGGAIACVIFFLLRWALLISTEQAFVVIAAAAAVAAAVQVIIGVLESARFVRWCTRAEIL